MTKQIHQTLTREVMLERGRRALRECMAEEKDFTPQQVAKRTCGGASNYLPVTRYWPSWEAFVQEVAEPIEPDFRRDEEELTRIEGARNYVVTCAVNNTPPEADFFAALKLYAELNNAELLVIPVRYKNPTSRRDPQEDHTRETEYWWHEAFTPYLIEDELRVHPLLRVMANVRVAATSPNPLAARRDARTKAESAIYGHPQLMMRTAPTPQNELPKVLYTTGAATQKNYSRTDQGDMADFHHTHGAVVIETRGDRFHVREINWGGEDFYDLDRRYTPKGSTTSPGVEALVMGDTHERQMDPLVREATFGIGGIVSKLNPKVVVQHDVLDGIAINPHERGRKLSEAVRAFDGSDNLGDELRSLADYLIDTDALHGGQTVIVSSNHDDFLLRWLQGNDRAVAPINRALYGWLTHMCIEHANENGGAIPNPLEIWFREHVNGHERVKFLGLDESYRVKDIELGMHGHLGPNGSRGTRANLSKIGTRSIVGHSHSPGIYQGCYQVGTSSNYRLGYNTGPSSWLQAHAVIHPNGKRQMIAIIKGHWRGE